MVLTLLPVTGEMSEQELGYLNALSASLSWRQLTVCCEFEGVAWLTFSPGLPFDIHGEGYDFEELGLIGTEANLRYFEKVTPNYIDCGTDVDKFINTCLQFK